MNFEAARWRRPLQTMLLYRNANDVRKQRLRDQACFGVTSRGRGQRAAIAANEMLAFAFVKRRGAAHVFQNLKH